MFSFWTLAAAYSLATVPARAQVLRGVVVDAQSDQPITMVYVGLVTDGADPVLIVAALTDTDGTFALRAPAGGGYYLYVSRLGYSPLTDGLYEMEEGGVLDIRVSLEPLPLTLDPVIVDAEARASRLERVGFYDRAAVGRGYFLMHEEIQKITVDRVTDVLGRAPRLEVISSRPAVGLTTELNPEVLVRWGTEYCSPTLYIDGAKVMFGSRAGARGRRVRPDDYVHPFDVEAVEVYTRAGDIPLQFGASDGCGVILIWTRTREW